MDTVSPDIATIQALRGDLAMQLARYIGRLGLSQVDAAKRLDLPQPTVSKIVNGRVADISLELLIRVAVRARLPMTLQTGDVAQEAGAYCSAMPSRSTRTFPSKLAEEARQSIAQLDASLSPSQRLEAFIEHNQLLAAFHQAGLDAEAQRLRQAPLET